MDKPGRNLGAALAVLALAVAGVTSLSATEPTAPAAIDVSKLSKDEIETLIYERQQLMTQIDKDAELLGDIVAGVEPAAKLKETTAALARDAKESHAAFSLKVPGGRTKPEAWSNWEDFSKRLANFAAGAEKVAKLGETGSVPAVNDVLGEALQCKSCHDLYREPKKPVT
ncbi:cytochrome c [Novosphingobium sp. MW5]|nr:cytochrome c [Novosphingobium sp. MW5]